MNGKEKVGQEIFFFCSIITELMVIQGKAEVPGKIKESPHIRHHQLVELMTTGYSGGHIHIDFIKKLK